MADENTQDPPELSDQELQDLVVVARPATVPEAIYLAEMLEEAGIPVADQRDQINPAGGYIGSSNRICVPRACRAKAEFLIHNAHARVEAQNVQKAFDSNEPSNFSDAAIDDRIMQKMLSIRDYDPESRERELVSCVTQWAIDGVPNLTIAKYLAAAGLNRQQGEDLVEAVVETQGEYVERKRNYKYLLGVAMIIAGVVLISLDFLAVSDVVRVPRKIFLVAGSIIGGGLFLIYNSERRLPSLKSAEKKDDSQGPPP